MTGFGIAEVHNEKISLTVQVKSVNGRFLESRFKLPREYQLLETELKKIIGEHFTRGTIDVYVMRAPGPEAPHTTIRLNTALAKAWVDSYRRLGTELDLSAHPSLDAVAHVPGVFQIGDVGNLEEWEKTQLFKAVKEAAKGCVSEREREGKSQAQVFESLLDELEDFVKYVQKHRKQLNDALREKLETRLKNLDPSITVDPQRIAAEVLMAVENSDIEEEVERAFAHIKAYRKLLHSKDAVGKKLEFYTQELHRETNTMGSKSHDVELTEKVIHAKAVVERLREQVQNVE